MPHYISLIVSLTILSMSHMVFAESDFPGFRAVATMETYLTMLHCCDTNGDKLFNNLEFTACGGGNSKATEFNETDYNNDGLLTIYEVSKYFEGFGAQPYNASVYLPSIPGCRCRMECY